MCVMLRYLNTSLAKYTCILLKAGWPRVSKENLSSLNRLKKCHRLRRLILKRRK